MRIVLCCGERNWDDQKKVDRALRHEHKKHPIDFVIEGGQSTPRGWPKFQPPYGADYQTKIAAQKLGIQVIECPANWVKFKKGAGPIRNSQQLRLAVTLAIEGGHMSNGPEQKLNLLVFAFHSNIKKSKGTKNMVDLVHSHTRAKVRIIK